MIAVLLLLLLALITIWQLVNVNLKNSHNHLRLTLFNQNHDLEFFELTSSNSKNHDNILSRYTNLGQSIAALTIQLQVAQKLWKINPPEAQQSVSEAYLLSINMMQEVRQIVKILNET